MIRSIKLFTLLFFFLPFVSNAQTVQLIGTSDEFILDNVKGYSSVEEVSLEHEEYNVLVFHEKETELTFYFTFFRGEKVCNYIKKKALASDLKGEIAEIKTTLKKVGDKRWENDQKTFQVDIAEADGIGLILVKSLR